MTVCNSTFFQCAECHDIQLRVRGSGFAKTELAPDSSDSRAVAPSLLMEIEKFKHAIFIYHVV